MSSNKLQYIIYGFKCWLFGHKHSCCPDITKRCSRCEFRKESWLDKQIRIERTDGKEPCEFIGKWADGYTNKPSEWSLLIRCENCGFLLNGNYCDYLHRIVEPTDFCSNAWGAGDDLYTHPFMHLGSEE